jgi:hypothetical protein
MSLEATAGGSASYDAPQRGFNVLHFGAAASITDNPTVSLGVLQGEQFSKRLLSPLPLDAILWLYNSGWPIRRIAMLCMQQVNALKNAPTAAGPMPRSPPEFADFSEVAWALQGLQSLGALTMGKKEKDSKTVVLRIEKSQRDSKPARVLIEKLGLTPGLEAYELVVGTGAGAGDRIEVLPRSLMGTLFYLSKGVEPAPDDARLDRPRVGLTFVGTDVFDWSTLLGGIFVSRSGDRRPWDAYVAVAYRGHWFYIEDTDVDSRVTLTLIRQLLSLQSGEAPPAPPLLIAK